jgi:FtsP/CotA-like multicopper oxidase with cupredoxin domain
LPEPICAENIYLSVAQRVDVIIDFSGCRPGSHVYLQNRLEQTQGQGPSGRLLPKPDNMLRFDVVDRKPEDNSRIPDTLRDLPPVDYQEVSRRRLWTFDYRGGQWTINGRTASPDMCRIDAEIQEGTAEIWTIRNEGKNWSHPIHSHFTEFLLLEVNGQKILEMEVNGQKILEPEIQTGTREEPRRTELRPLASAAAKAINRKGEFQCTGTPAPNFMGGNRRDVATLLPDDEIVIFMRWQDFHGRYVMHCHNVVHEDHAMMIRWDIVPQGKPETPISCKSCDTSGEMK